MENVNGKVKAKAEAKAQTFFSGGPGTTGREPFEDSTATGPGQAYIAGNTSGGGAGVVSSATVPGGHDHRAHHGSRGQGVDATGETASGQYGSVSDVGAAHGHHDHEGHGHRGAGTGLGTAGQTGQSGARGIDEATAGSGTTAAGVGAGAGTYGSDKVGNLGQNSAMYERTGDQGPATTGAAGTDRFDSDKRGTGIGAHRDAPGGYGSPQDVNETRQRAEGKSSGGVAGVLGTSEKDFTGRDRLPGSQSAYTDTQGLYKLNTSGPGGKSALTGREGNFEDNPVAKATGAGAGTDGVGAAGVGTGRTETRHASAGSPTKRGFVQKVKDALH